ncbi:MAG: glycerophosphodiester phosphodiesterase, partial [Pseudobdellovibrionaceae bacterium]
MKKSFLLILSLFAASCASTPERKVSSLVEKPIIIGHRGASGYLPEHTLASYEKAIDMGADYVEPDLVLTKDGILISRHENDITKTTDVSTKFPGRKKKKTIDGIKIEGWFTEDFTLAEIKTLRVKEWIPFRSKENDGKFPVATFQEIIDLVNKKGLQVGKPIGIYPELKHPSYFESIGLPLEPKLIEALNKNHMNHQDALVFVQSFEPTCLQKLKPKLDVPLVFLIDTPNQIPYDLVLKREPKTYKELTTDQGLQEIATYAKGVGPWKHHIIPAENGKLGMPTDFVKRAHAAGLLVHPYTMRNEPYFLPKEYGGNPELEYHA